MIKANDFVSRNHIAIPRAEFDKIIKDFKIMSLESPDIDDPKYDWKNVYPSDSDEKYGIIMVSYTQKVWRAQTMGEFYGGGIVD